MDRKNVAGQYCYFEFIDANGDAISTGTAYVNVVVGTTRSAGGGSCTFVTSTKCTWAYAATQAETNHDAVHVEAGVDGVTIPVGKTYYPKVHESGSGLPSVNKAYENGVQIIGAGVSGNKFRATGT